MEGKDMRTRDRVVAAMEEIEEAIAHLNTAVGHFMAAPVPLAGSDVLIVVDELYKTLDDCEYAIGEEQ